MKKRMNWKTGCALALAAVTLVSGISVAKVHAASKIDLTQTAKLTIAIPSETDYKELATSTINIELYQVATVDEYGTYTSEIDGLADNQSRTAEDVMKLVEAADTYVGIGTASQKSPDKTVTIANTADTTSVTESFEGSKGEFGIYLMHIPTIQTAGFAYSFSDSLVTVPGNAYVNAKTDDTAATASDAWVYDASNMVSLKPEYTELFGDLTIYKEVETYDTSLNATSFVYQVTAYKDYSIINPERSHEEVVYNDVVTINVNAAGDYALKIDNIPANANVTVTEVYTGASYGNRSPIAQGTTIVSDEEVALGEGAAYVGFSNTYNNKLLGNGTAVVNKFTKNETWSWTTSTSTQTYQAFPENTPQ